MPKAPFHAGKCLLSSMAIGLVIALIVTGSMKAKLKSGSGSGGSSSHISSSGQTHGGDGQNILRMIEYEYF